MTDANVDHALGFCVRFEKGEKKGASRFASETFVSRLCRISRILPVVRLCFVRLPSGNSTNWSLSSPAATPSFLKRDRELSTPRDNGNVEVGTFPYHFYNTTRSRKRRFVTTRVS